MENWKHTQSMHSEHPELVGMSYKDRHERENATRRPNIYTFMYKGFECHVSSIRGTASGYVVIPCALADEAHPIDGLNDLDIHMGLDIYEQIGPNWHLGIRCNHLCDSTEYCGRGIPGARTRSIDYVVTVLHRICNYFTPA